MTSRTFTEYSAALVYAGLVFARVGVVLGIVRRVRAGVVTYRVG